MSSKSKGQTMSTGNSVYGNSSVRGRGNFIKITAIFLLFVAGIWVYLSTQSLKTTTPSSTQRALDPAAPPINK